MTHTEIYHIYHTNNLVLNKTCLVCIETFSIRTSGSCSCSWRHIL